jgi:hypothetical protein
MEHDFEGINLHFPVECNRIDGSLSPATYYLLAGSVFILMNQLVGITEWLALHWLTDLPALPEGWHKAPLMR